MISLSFLSPFVISQVSLGPGERTYCPREQGVSQKCRLHPGAETHRILESVLLLSLHWSLAAAVAWGARAQPPLQSSHPGAAFHSPHPSLSASPLLLPSTGAFLLDRTVSNQSRCRRTTACPSFFFFKFIFFIYFWLRWVCCCARAFSSCGERGLLFVAVRRLLIAVASLVAEHGL